MSEKLGDPWKRKIWIKGAPAAATALTLGLNSTPAEAVEIPETITNVPDGLKILNEGALKDPFETGAFAFVSIDDSALWSSTEGRDPSLKGRRVNMNIEDMFTGKSLPTADTFSYLLNGHDHPIQQMRIVYPFLRKLPENRLKSLLSGPSAGDTGASGTNLFGMVGLSMFLGGKGYLPGDNELDSIFVNALADAGGYWVSRASTYDDYREFPGTSRELETFLAANDSLHSRIKQRLMALDNRKLAEYLTRLVPSYPGDRQAMDFLSPRRNSDTQRERQALMDRWYPSDTGTSPSSNFRRALLFLVHEKTFNFGRRIAREQEDPVFKILQELKFSDKDLQSHDEEAAILNNFRKLDATAFEAARLPVIRASVGLQGNLPDAIQGLREAGVRHGGAKIVFVPKERVDTIPSVARQLAASYNDAAFKKAHGIF